MLSIVLDEQWKRLRSLITPAFTSGKLRRMLPHIFSTTQTLLTNMNDHLEKNGSVMELKHMTNAFTMDTIIQTAFGTKIDSLKEPNSPIVKHASKFFEKDISLKDFGRFFLMSIAPKISKKIEIQFNPEFNKFCLQLATKIIDEKKSSFGSQLKEADPTKASNFIELMLEARRETENNQTVEENDTSKPTNSKCEFALNTKSIFIFLLQT